MNQDQKENLAEYLIALGDDELILGHRNSEWCGHAPILEEDIALANIALDEIGHARLWYQAAAELLGEDSERYPDGLVFQRDHSEFKSMQIVQLANEDWALTIMRQYLIDSLETIRLAEMKKSKYKPIADISNKILIEEFYHLRHSSAWVLRLGKGTEESHRRIQNALNQLWSYTSQFVISLPNEKELTNLEIVPAGENIEKKWLELVDSQFEESDLMIEDEVVLRDLKRSESIKSFENLINELQSVAKEFPNAEW